MKKLIPLAAIGLLLTVEPALAQSPRGRQKSPAVVEKEKLPGLGSMSMSEMTPEMWLYVQERSRHDDPKEAVRRKAEYRTAQRQRRIAAREWFGYSNARPRANSDPWHSEYSAHWSANNAVRPDQWIGNGRSAYRR
ncbi:MAG: hypothetical protein ACREHD_25935 [Pirellulales bacterium]